MSEQLPASRTATQSPLRSRSLSEATTATLLSAQAYEGLSRLPSIDSSQLLDIYDSEITRALELFGIGGIPALRENQAPAIACALDDQNLVLSLATGAGKSLCFQVPAAILSRHGKVTVVLQPTLEIIANQVRALEGHDIDVKTFSSLTSHEERGELAERMRQGYRPALVYTTVDSFFGSYRHVFFDLRDEGALARVVLDEAHTAIHWEDFKPSMKHLSKLRQLYPKTPVTVATATITLADRATLLGRLSTPLASWRIISGSTDRPNLHLSVQPVHSFYHSDRMRAVSGFLEEFGIAGSAKHTGIVFCATSQRCDQVVRLLNDLYGERYATAAYGERHGMDHDTRLKVIRDWMAGKFKVLVATVAFGMGMDKGDVRFVIHYDVPKTLENYAQEVGRAGRDGAPAYCILLYSWQDAQRAIFYAELNNPTTIDRDIVKILAMSQYARSLTMCRHIQLTSYFGAGPVSSLAPCLTACDNCVRADSLAESNVTVIARPLVSMFKSQALGDGARGLKRIVNTLRGIKAKKDVLPDASKLEQYGNAKNFPHEIVQSVLDTLLAHDILRASSTAHDPSGRPRWSSTDLTFTLGSRALESELFEDTADGRHMVIRTFGAASQAFGQQLVNPVSGRTSPAIDLTREDLTREVDENATGPPLSAKARGKRPERATFRHTTSPSSLASLATREYSSSALDHTFQKTRPQPLSLKRKHVDSDDEYGASSTRVATCSRHIRPPFDKSTDAADDPSNVSVLGLRRATRNGRGPLSSSGASARHGNPSSSAEIIEISSSEDESADHPVRGHRAVRSSTTPVNARASGSDVVPTRLASAIRLLEKGRRVAFEQHHIRDHLQDEYGVLSDRALVALAAERPTDGSAFVTTLKNCGVREPEEKWILYGAHFRAIIRSGQFLGALRVLE